MLADHVKIRAVRPIGSSFCLRIEDFETVSPWERSAWTLVPIAGPYQPPRHGSEETHHDLNQFGQGALS